MAEESDTGERKAGAEGAAAIGIAISEAGRDPSLAEDARTLLREQARLARLEADDLFEQGSLMRWSLRVRHASQVMKFAFELLVALVLIAIVAAFASALWTAAHDNGLVIEAFSVPPDLAARGLRGEVIANQLLDKLTRMQDETNSIRPADTYRNNWGDDIKVEIPDTGISIGELNRYLRRWLGHETHITGEIYRTPAGIAVTARAQDAGETFTGSETGLDGLLQRAAEAIYAETQPYRYAAFLDEKRRYPEAIAVLKNLSAEANPTERAWALSLLGDMYRFYNRPEEALATLRDGVRADPANAHAWDNLSSTEIALGHIEGAWRHTQKALSLYDNGSAAFDPNRLVIIKLQDRSFLANALGDYRTAGEMDEDIRSIPYRGGSHIGAAADEATEAAFNHELSRARSILAGLHAVGADERITVWFQSATVTMVSEDWPRLEKMLDRDAVFGLGPASFRPVLEGIYVRGPQSALALAHAEEGDIAGARALIAGTPGDCNFCLRARGKIDAAAKNRGGAAFWFARAAEQAPDIPVGYSDWGEMLLDNRDYDGAIAKFAAAHEKGPHFADPLELWGEALMHKNRSDLALAKFAEAAKYAPNWGRLHLKWGEALLYTGKRDDAERQFGIASRLDMSSADAATLKHLRATDG